MQCPLRKGKVLYHRHQESSIATRLGAVKSGTFVVADEDRDGMLVGVRIGGDDAEHRQPVRHDCVSVEQRVKLLVSFQR